MQTFKIACEGCSLISYEKLKPFQGNLKDLSIKNYEKLKKLILELGFSDPISVWRESLTENGEYSIIDGHQRLRVVIEMQKEGCEIPLLPINLISADSYEQAKKKVLVLTSQYGEVTEDGLNEFRADANIDFKWISESLNFPEIDLDHWRKNYDEIELNEKELDENIGTTMECPKCGHIW